MNIYHLPSAVQAIIAEIDDLDDNAELSIDQINRITDLEEDSRGKIDLLYKVVRFAVVNEQACRAEAARISKRAGMWAGIYDNARRGIFALLRAWKTDKMKTALCTASVCKGPPKVHVDEGFDPASLRGTEFAGLIEESVVLLGKKIKDIDKAGGKLPAGIKVIEGDAYLKIT